MEFDAVMHELEALGTERTRKSYVSRGVREPLFGVATGAMKPLNKRIGVDQGLAEKLWRTGNYDAMYFAGMIADVAVMTEEDFDRWMDSAYGPMLSDFVVAVTLAESALAQSVATRWIRSGEDERASAGWACYEWLLGWRPDDYFHIEALRELLKLAALTVRQSSPRLSGAANRFIVAVGVSYVPLHEEALAAAEELELVLPSTGPSKPAVSAAEQIRKVAAKGRIGFKRRAVRC